MNETLGLGYARIDDIRAARGEPFSRVNESDSPPKDEIHIVYLALLIAGTAFLLPFNSFIMGAEFFKTSYRDSTIVYDITTVYIISACISVMINNILIYYFHYSKRITFGICFTMCFMVLMTTANLTIYRDTSPKIAYIINMIGIGLIAFGCTVQQASYYSFVGCLPAKYTQAVMMGESAAGFWVCLDRILTKHIISDHYFSTVVFVFLSILTFAFHGVFHYAMNRQDFVNYYINLMTKTKLKRRIQLHLTPNDDAALVGNMDHETTDTSYGVLKIQSPPLTAAETVLEEMESTAFSFTNPVYSPTTSVPATNPEQSTSSPTRLGNHRPSYVVEDVVDGTSERPHTTWNALKNGVLVRWTVAKAIYPYMVSIGLLYFTTLSLYPGITSEVKSCRFGTWMPVILMLAYNFSDLTGKVATSWHYIEWSRSQLLMASGLRLLLVPLVLLCAAPRQSPHIVGDIYPIMFCLVLGFTNGLFSSVTMMSAPARIGREYREIAGNVMTLSYNGGLLSGTLVSYLLLSMLGSPGALPCRVYPTPPLPTVSIPTTTLFNTSITTLVQH